ncbi:MAG: hypothetical protein ACD_37C00206G0001 [uncultured bacterium]|nr:MAG: hypothetical protein ACD_37C00206G0001 [uncultured bacterium]
MLTKTDLDQLGKVVRKIVREEVEAEVSDSKNSLGAQVTMTKLELKQKINDLDDRIKNTEIKLNGIGKDMKDVKKRVIKTEKTVDIMIDLFDKEIVKTQKRVTRIEDHLRI